MISVLSHLQPSCLSLSPLVSVVKHCTVSQTSLLSFRVHLSFVVVLKEGKVGGERKEKRGEREEEVGICYIDSWLVRREREREREKGASYNCDGLWGSICGNYSLEPAIKAYI